MAFKCLILAAVLAVANAGYLGGYGAPAAYGSSIAYGSAYGAAPVAAYGAVASPLAYGSAYHHGAVAAPLAYHGAVASPALVSQHSNILRTPGNLGQVSTYSKTINTPYSSVSKSDVRVSNDALAYHHAPAVAAYAAPAYHGAAYAAPAVAAYATPAYHGAAYAAPIARAAYAAPAVAAYAAPAYHGAAYAAPIARAAYHGAGYAYGAPAYAGAYHGGAYAAPAIRSSVSALSGHGLLGVAYSAAPAVAHMSYSNGYGLNYAW